MNQKISPEFLPVMIALSIWSLFWKGVVLWKAAQFKQRNWFIAFILLFPVNTLGILEFIYLFKFAHKKLTFGEIKSWFFRDK